MSPDYSKLGMKAIPIEQKAAQPILRKKEFVAILCAEAGKTEVGSRRSEKEAWGMGRFCSKLLKLWYNLHEVSDFLIDILKDEF